MNEPSVKRLQSIDALRGFDMFWIMGAPGIIAALYGLFGGNAFEWCNTQMEHVPWDGFHFMDMVFPLFLFIAGVSFPFSLDKRREQAESNAVIYKHLLKRTVLLILLGIIYNGGLKHDFDTAPRLASVLAHIGLAWFFGAIIFMNTKKAYVRVLWIAGLIIGYGLLNALVLSPNAVGTNPFVLENNIVTQFDRWFLPGRLYKENYDPEGILSLIPAISTALMGMISGNFLKNNLSVKPSRKALSLLLFGVVLIALAMVSGEFIPFNKRLWSSSFALLTGGISLMLLALFYFMVDVLQWTRWSYFFRVIGMNSITIYMAQALINFQDINVMLLGGISSLFPDPVGELILNCGYVAVCWLFLWFMYKKKIFIKV